jgi:HK97 family phage portal protein
VSIIARRTETRSTTDKIEALIRQANYGTAGVYVDENSALRHDAVWSCRTRIAQDVSMMPVDVVRYVNGTRQDVAPVPQIIAAPSTAVRAIDWRYQVVDSWLADGNAWGLITQSTGNGLYPTRIELLSPSCVRVESIEGMRYYVDNVEEWLWPVGRLWHVPAYTVAGSPLGLSPIQFHRVTIGIGLGAEKYGADFFDGGGHPTGILAPKVDPGEMAAKSLKQKFAEVLRGSREVIVVPQDTTYTQIQTSPTDSQFIDTMRYSVEQVCRIYGEDPADHGASSGGSSMTYANRSDADLARFKRRQFWVTKLQDALTELVQPGQVVKLNTSSSLMMTTKERHELHKLRLDSKTTTINDVKRVEDESPFEGDEYDEPGIPDGSTAEAEIERQAVILQKMYLAVGVVLTADEAREMARQAGIDLPVNYDPALLGAAPQPSPGGDQ